MHVRREGGDAVGHRTPVAADLGAVTDELPGGPHRRLPLLLPLDLPEPLQLLVPGRT